MQTYFTRVQNRDGNKHNGPTKTTNIQCYYNPLLWSVFYLEISFGLYNYCRHLGLLWNSTCIVTNSSPTMAWFLPPQIMILAPFCWGNRSCHVSICSLCESCFTLHVSPSTRPLWLSPRQVMLVPVNPSCEDYAKKVWLPHCGLSLWLFLSCNALVNDNKYGKFLKCTEH